MKAETLISGVSLGVSVIGFAVAILTLQRGNNNSSAATLVGLQTGFSNCWDNLRKAIRDEDEDSRKFYLAELLNLFESACGIINEGTLTGASKKLMVDYVCDCFRLLKELDVQCEARNLIDTNETYKEIRIFEAAHENGQFLAGAKENAREAGVIS
ncbi:MAG TPA: hypothetical protein VFS41_01915 [Edaphobacter sp.]|nr:hypothetical protein [Edaphobacter sp.]